jgi:RNA polymerase sigma-70 factor (ECF subfamily)
MGSAVDTDEQRRLVEAARTGDGDAWECLYRNVYSRPAADRELLELRVMAGLSSEQTAAVLGRTPGAVRTAQSRALARLRQLLEEREQ